MNKFLFVRIICTVVILIVAIQLSAYFDSRPKLASGQEPLKDLQSIETLREQFNHDFGKTRLILFFSPT